MENGRPFDVPDFRNKRERRKYRSDHFAQPRYDVEKGCFPKKADKRLTGRFSAIVRDLVRFATTYRAFADWQKVAEFVKEPAKVAEFADNLIRDYPEMLKAMKAARKLADAYPRSDGARVLREMLEVADEAASTSRGFLKELKRRRSGLRAKPRRRSRG